MNKKKKVFVTPGGVSDAELATIRITPEAVLCPVHQRLLKVERGNQGLFAICDCAVPGNPWKGRVVWEKLF